MKLTDTNRRSKLFPLSLASRYEQAINDPELMSHRQDLGLIEVRIEQLMKRMQNDEQPDRWKDLQQRFSELKFAQIENDTAGFANVCGLIETIFKDIQEDYAAWDQIMDILELRRKINESELKRLIAMNQMISAEDAMKLVAQLLAAIKRNMSSNRTFEEMYKGIAYEFNLLTGSLDRVVPAGGGSEDIIPDGSDRLDQNGILDPGT